jgi:hypothetical protein
MSNENQVVETTVKTPKRRSVSLTAGEGAKLMRLTVLAQRTRSGGQVVVVTTDAKKKTERGMTKKFDTFELAVAALGKLVQDAVQKGWKRSERAGGFKARPDAFTSIPVAPKAGAR